MPQTQLNLAPKRLIDPERTARTLIVYACPLGELARQIDRYYAISRAICGPNAAHDYMPHCTLTGFFHDDAAAIERYAAALGAALGRARASQPAAPLEVVSLELGAEFHGLLLRGEWLKQMIADFADSVDSSTRRDDLRLKGWLHLSLAYGFPPEQGEALAGLAREFVNVTAPVRWELRLYERNADWSWICHASWPL
jgi:ubiquitin-associated SH3 domain-containing protein